MKFKRKLLYIFVILMVCYKIFDIFYSKNTGNSFQYGIDALVNSNFDVLNKNKNNKHEPFCSKRFAILTHAGTTNLKGEYTLGVLLRQKHLNCARILFPEHNNPFHKKEWESINPSKLPSYCTHWFAKDKKDSYIDPEDKQLCYIGDVNKLENKLDAVVIDLQGVGMRYYTYTASALRVMMTCWKNDVEVIVLDRPNPLGNYIGGPSLNINNKSFLGTIENQPLFHGMTLGEIATYIKMRNEDFNIHSMKGVLPECAMSVEISKEELQKGKLTVVKMNNYDRTKVLYENLPTIKDKGIKLSPKIQIYDHIAEYAVSSLAYIACSKEHTICFEGLLSFLVDFSRDEEGFAHFKEPGFKYFYSPRASAQDIIDYLNQYPEALEGISLSIVQKKEREYVDCRVVDLKKTKPALFSLALIKFAQSVTKPGEWKTVKKEWQLPMLRAHLGDDELYECLINDKTIDFDYFKDLWKAQAEQWKLLTQKHYLY